MVIAEGTITGTWIEIETENIIWWSCGDCDQHAYHFQRYKQNNPHDSPPNKCQKKISGAHMAAADKEILQLKASKIVASYVTDWLRSYYNIRFYPALSRSTKGYAFLTGCCNDVCWDDNFS